MDRVEVLLTADEAYAMPLAVTAASVAASLSTSRRPLLLHVFDVGISTASRRRIEGPLRRPGVEVNWIAGVDELVAGLPEIWWFSTAIHARVFAPALLPSSTRVIYLDSDVVVNHDLGELFDTDLEDDVAGAVPDTRDPFVCCADGVPLWFELGRPPSDPYFNSGVLLMDLEAWRREGVAEASLRCIRDAPEGVIMLNQNSLNTVAGQRIKPLDPRWNQQTEVLNEPRSANQLPYPRDEVARLKVDPWIIHFNTADKPWHPGYQHPFLGRWFEHLDQTDWAGWRPPGPPEPNRVQAITRRIRPRIGTLARKAKLL